MNEEEYDALIDRAARLLVAGEQLPEGLLEAYAADIGRPLEDAAIWLQADARERAFALGLAR